MKEWKWSNYRPASYQNSAIRKHDSSTDITKQPKKRPPEMLLLGDKGPPGTMQWWSHLALLPSWTHRAFWQHPTHSLRHRATMRNKVKIRCFQNWVNAQNSAIKLWKCCWALTKKGPNRKPLFLLSYQFIIMIRSFDCFFLKYFQAKLIPDWGVRKRKYLQKWQCRFSWQNCTEGQSEEALC